MNDLLDRAVDLLAPLAHIDPRWALLALAFHLGNLVCRATAWRNVLAAAYPDERFSATRVGMSYAVGVGLNGYLPARGGDAAKVGLVRMQHPDTCAVTIASSCTVVVLFDALVGLSIFSIAWATGALPTAPRMPATLATITSSPIVTLGIVAAIALGIGMLVRRFGPRLRSGLAHARQGVAVLQSPVRYARTVLSVQTLAWCCRIGVVTCMLAAFGIPASLPLAALLVVAGGMSTIVPVPGGAGTQQALAIVLLAAVATTSQALSYSVGLQVAVTVVNTSIGILAAMLMFGRLHPLRASCETTPDETVRPSEEQTSRP
jgi:uncharacterized membrane protein YbhN (UPF0104 family)